MSEKLSSREISPPEVIKWDGFVYEEDQPDAIRILRSGRNVHIVLETDQFFKLY